MFSDKHTKERVLVVFGTLALLRVGAEAQGQEQVAAAEIAQGAPVPLEHDITATFSIVAADPETGVCGAAVASMYPDVGRVVPYARAGVGAFCTQHAHHPPWGEKALDWLAQGKAPEAVLAELLGDDERREQRQLAIIDMAGRAAVHNPTQAGRGSRYWGAMTGRFYSCQGNTLTGGRIAGDAKQLRGDQD